MHSHEGRDSTACLELLNVNAGLHILRRILAGSVPTDFEWWFRVSDKGVAAGWVWAVDYRYQDEISAVTVADLVRDWWRVDWRAQRARARQWSSHLQAGGGR